MKKRRKRENLFTFVFVRVSNLISRPLTCLQWFGRVEVCFIIITQETRVYHKVPLKNNRRRLKPLSTLFTCESIIQYLYFLLCLQGPSFFFPPDAPIRLTLVHNERTSTQPARYIHPSNQVSTCSAPFPPPIHIFIAASQHIVPCVLLAPLVHCGFLPQEKKGQLL